MVGVAERDDRVMSRTRGRQRRRVIVAPLVVAVVVSVAGCSGDGDGDPGTSPSVTEPAPTTTDEPVPTDDVVDGADEGADTDDATDDDPGNGRPDADDPDAADPGSDEPPSGAEVGVAWERVEDDPRVFGAVTPVVTALGTGVDSVLAVGRTRDGSRALLLWTSSDGRTWSVADGAAAFGGASAGSVEIRDLIARGNGFVAVGIEALEPEASPVDDPATDGDGDGDSDSDLGDPGGDGAGEAGSIGADAGAPSVATGSSGRIRGAVWVSGDGATWERVGDGAALLEGDGNVLLTAVATGGPGLIAVGSVDVDDDRHGAVWVSNDGTGWLRVPHEPGVFGDSGRTSIEAVAVDPARVVAVGVAPGIGRETRGAVWVSDDGIGWRAVDHDSTVFGGVGTSVRINAVSVGGPGFVAVGSERLLVDGGVRFDAAVWLSADGEDWERVDPTDPVFAGVGSQVLWDVVAVDDRLIAVGGDTGAGAVWISDDGRAWERVAAPVGTFGDDGATQVQRIVVLGDRVIAAGVSDEFVPIWSSPPSDG